VNVEIVTIGDELLLGFTIDTNSAHLARELAALGVAIARRSTCGDAAEDISAAVLEALDRTGAVITTGGLGPTSDDLTKPSIAAIFGREMQLDESVLENLKARWKARGWPGEMPAANHQQAMIPEGAEILANRHGSAPGIWLEDDQGRWVAMLPGVPREMRGMCADVLLPRIRERLGANATVIASRTLRTTGVAESTLPDFLGPLAGGFDGLSLAYLPGWEGVDLRLTCRGHSAAGADAALEKGAAALRARLGAHIYGEGSDDLAAIVLELLRGRSMKIAVAESCTGGMLGARLTAVPGSSDVMIGGVIAYANEVKVSQLGVREATLVAHGAVSDETASEMATGARARFGADVAVAITGIAGPGGGTPEKPVGTICLAVDVGGAVRAFRPIVVGDRDEIRRRSAQAALSLVRRALTETL
jgi:nicotinamide-nucleotide amidase